MNSCEKGKGYLFNQVDCRLQVKTKVNKVPRNALSAVLLLLQHEHGVVEELLKLLIRVVYAELFERVDLKRQSFYDNLKERQYLRGMASESKKTSTDITCICKLLRQGEVENKT